MRRVLFLIVSLTCLLAVVAPGCYTVLMHPVDRAGDQVAQTTDCTSCHAEYHQYPYGYYYSPYPAYWWDYPNYSSYYAHPWWWSHFDYPAYDDGGSSSDGSEDGRGTKFDRREAAGTPLPPPYVNPYGGGRSTPRLPDQLNIPTETQGGTTTSGGGESTRPQTETGGATTESRSKEKDKPAPSGKESRQPAKIERPQPKASQSAPAKDTSKTTPTPEKPKKVNDQGQSR